MKRSCICCVAAVRRGHHFAVSDLADAERLGGGSSLGAQRQSVAPQARPPRDHAELAAASQPVMPAQPGATLPAQARRPRRPRRRRACRAGWARSPASPPGLGLAALLSHFGLPEGLGQRSCCWRCSRSAASSWCACCSRGARRPRRSPMQYAGAPSSARAERTTEPPTRRHGAARRKHRTRACGCRAAAAAGCAARSRPGSTSTASSRQAKLQFIRLQAAYDAGDRDALADVMTPEMFAEIARELDGRGSTRRRRWSRSTPKCWKSTTEGEQALGERALHRPRARGRRGACRSRSTKSGT